MSIKIWIIRKLFILIRIFKDASYPYKKSGKYYYIITTDDL